MIDLHTVVGDQHDTVIFPPVTPVFVSQPARIGHASVEQAFHALAELLPDIVVEADLTGRLTYCNTLTAALTGYSLYELTHGRTCFDLMIPEQVTQARHDLDELLAGRTHKPREYQARRKDGSTFPVLVRVLATGEPGRVTGLRVVVVDLSPARQVERQLANTLARHRAMLEAIPDLMFLVDRQGRFLDFNANSNSDLYTPAEHIIGSTIADLLPAEAAAELMVGLERAFQSQEIHIVEYQLTIDNLPSVFEARMVRSSPDEMLVIVRNITQTKQLMERLAREQREHGMLTLAGGLAHDMNNLLVGIQGSAALLSKALPAGTPLRRHTETITVGASRLALLADKLLAYARGKDLDIQTHDGNVLIHDALLLARPNMSPQVRIKNSLAADLWPIHGDGTMLVQVLLNFIINGAEAIGRHRGTLTLGTANLSLPEPFLAHGNRQLPAGEYISLQVTDSGVGMDEATQRRLFTPFFSTKANGRGLGLASCRGICDKHHGAIRVHSAPHQGSTFELLLPRLPPEVPTMATPVHNRPSATIDRKVVMLIDDEEMVRTVIQEMLEVAGYSVVTAATGQEGLAKYGRADQHVDLVLLDWQLPDVAGHEMVRRLKTMHPEVGIVLCSGDLAGPTDARVPAAEVQGLLQKPFNYDDLITRVHDLLQS